MDAVILAAGLGSRIRDMHAIPKGFICVGERPIIEESIEKLKACGIDNIFIVTGFASPYYEALAKKQNAITTIFNPNYHSSGSLYSLYCAKNAVKNDFLVLESDILYEKNALEVVISDPNPNLILLSGETQSGDEVYVEAHDRKLINMSKQKDKLNKANIYGEFVGINKLNYIDYQKLMCDITDSELLQTGHYEEHGLVTLAKKTDVFCKKENIVWCEIDNRAQFDRAKELYARMQNCQRC